MKKKEYEKSCSPTRNENWGKNLEERTHGDKTWFSPRNDFRAGDIIEEKAEEKEEEGRVRTL